ncbi:MAG: signal peptidase II [Pelagibacterales bacterium MED-G40]|nr:MAG: signal peptidase II [Pelagibacterales bacterium MED-G40]|tara:strand:+ start:789 stop:1289 length:501 start_codon:yes stop_codon:yes gene_type:complete
MNELKNRILNKINILNLLIIVLIFVADRFSKIKIINYVLSNNKSIYVNDYLNLELVWNSGIGFGLLNLDAGIWYHFISLIIFFVILAIIYLMIKSSNLDKIFLSLVLGGALGNLYDRALYFSVPDFIDIHFNDFHWFTFNIADIFISLGIILILLKEVFLKKHEKN